ncbi:hypothetical protein F8A87_04360 [Betaproteobacteria bacterium SCN2]|nr:hypothetical protein F8A87_04360 [Betaproteobacteria bacterium SCN2]
MSYSRLANVIELRSGGITVLRGIFDKTSVRHARAKVLDNRFLFKNTRPTPSAGHLAGFHRFPALEPLHTMLSCNSAIIEFLDFRLNGEGVRSIGLSDITINRSQEWHNDLLRGKFQDYLDDALNWDVDGGGVYKVLFYLQDGASLKYIKGSHTKPIPLENDRYAEPGDGTEITSVCVNAGDVVVMDIRCSHRGAEESFYANGQFDENPRILISTVLGGVNHKLTNAMEAGNFQRLQDWMRRHP